MNKKIKTDAVDHLFEAILTLKTPEECYAFFEDVCTVNELLSLSQRYEVAKMLREKRTYLDIAESTGASTATISRVNRSLNYGSARFFRNLQIGLALSEHLGYLVALRKGKELINGADIFKKFVTFFRAFKGKDRVK